MSIGRPLEFDPEQALDAAMQAFWARGYAATSLQNLLDAMDLSKSSFYQSFGGKLQLFERCLKRYREQMAAAMLERLNQAESGRQFIEDMLASVDDMTCSSNKPRGCLVMNTAIEFAQSDPTVAEWVSQGVDRFTAIFQAAVQRAQHDGEIPADKDPEALARYLVTSMSGLKTMTKAGIEGEEIGRIIQFVLKALD